MIFPAVDIIRQELVAGGVNADLGNIVEIIGSNTNTTGVQADVIISLINIEENRISRDPRNYTRVDNGILMKNPAVHLYLTLLFTAVRQQGYGLALQDLQKVIGVFQQKYVYDHANTPALQPYPDIEELILDMVSLTLQQLHEIWSVLGGRYYPSVVYRMRMVTIDSVTKLTGPLITEIDSEYYQM
jgi:hypothetical protein